MEKLKTLDDAYVEVDEAGDALARAWDALLDTLGRVHPVSEKCISLFEDVRALASSINRISQLVKEAKGGEMDYPD